MKALIGSLALLFLLSIDLSGQQIEEIVVDIDQSSMPEGIAIHPETGAIYISSIRLDKITKSDKNGQHTVDVIDAREQGFAFGTGMMISQNHLFACGKLDRGNQPIVLQIDLDNHEIIKTYQLPDGDSAFFNDLALDQDLNAYFTDNNTNKLYRLDYQSGTVSFFMEDEGMTSPNGITISPDGTKLYVNSNKEGIRIIDIASKKVINKPHEASKDTGVDGLAYHKGALYAVYNYGGKELEKHGLVKFELSDDGADITNTVPLNINHPRHAIPTTVAIYDGHAYYIANSQFGNFNWDENTVKDPTILTDTYVLKVKIED